MYSDSFIEKMCSEGAIVGYAADFHLPNETTHAHTGTGVITFGGNTYFGVGEMGKIGSISSVADANPSEVELGMVGLPSDIFTEVMSAQIRGSKVELYKVLFTEGGQVLDVASVLVGSITDYSWKFEEKGEISLIVSDEFSLYERPLQKYYTQHSWNADNEGDNFWQYVAQMADKEIHWGAEQDGAKFTQD